MFVLIPKLDNIKYERCVYKRNVFTKIRLICLNFLKLFLRLHFVVLLLTNCFTGGDVNRIGTSSKSSESISWSDKEIVRF